MTSEGPKLDRNAMRSLMGDVIDEFQECRHSGRVSGRAMALWSEILDAEIEIERSDNKLIRRCTKIGLRKWIGRLLQCR
ncbi:MAG: hypothetical protein A2Y38_15185 [Spirochaetes bacterium GWB1_59_5]|nr:MAG: hypothetical protein A2Y38_15185 [Spirochaetes bacterium GWB1_59_5]